MHSLGSWPTDSRQSDACHLRHLSPVLDATRLSYCDVLRWRRRPKRKARNFIRARGQRVATIEARSGIFRHPTRHGRITQTSQHLLVFSSLSLLHEGLHCTADVQHAPPDLPVLDHQQRTKTSHHNRERRIREVNIEAITHATAVAKATGPYTLKPQPQDATPTTL
eukprot:1094789-Pyramimonas_sp.AAC.1